VGWQTLRADALGEDLNRALKVASRAGGADLPRPVARPGRERRAGAAAAGRALPRLWTNPPAPTSGRLRSDLARCRTAAPRRGRRVVVAGRRRRSADPRGNARRAGGGEDRRTIESRPCPTDHPFYAGFYSPTLETVRTADVILLAGSRSFIEFETPAAPAVAGRGGDHPPLRDPAEIGKTYPADVALVGDAGLALADLRPRSAGPLPRAARIARRDRCRRARDVYLASQEGQGRRRPGWPGSRRSASRRCCTRWRCSSTIAPGWWPTRLPGARNLNLSAAARLARLPTTASGSLGWGMGAALGIKLAAPEDDVIAVVGDGVFSSASRPSGPQSTTPSR